MENACRKNGIIVKSKKVTGGISGGVWRKMKITGVMVQYFIACKRELWFFSHRINLNVYNELIALGRLIHEKTYKREKKNILIDDTISIDFIKKGKELLVFEIKKSSKLEEPVRYQLLYYLYYLKKKGIHAIGYITYPKERKRERIVLTHQKENEIAKILKEIPKIVSLEHPPPPIKKGYCKSCSYYEFCWV